MLQSRSFPRRVRGSRSSVRHRTSWLRPPTLIFTLREHVLLLMMSTGSGGRESVDLEVFLFKPGGAFSAILNRTKPQSQGPQKNSPRGDQLKRYRSEAVISTDTTGKEQQRPFGYLHFSQSTSYSVGSRYLSCTASKYD